MKLFLFDDHCFWTLARVINFGFSLVFEFRDWSETWQTLSLSCRQCAREASRYSGSSFINSTLVPFIDKIWNSEVFLFFLSWICVMQETLSFWSCNNLSFGVLNNSCWFSLIVCIKFWSVVSMWILIWILHQDWKCLISLCLSVNIAFAFIYNFVFVCNGNCYCK